MKRIIYFLLGMIFGFFLGRWRAPEPVQAPASPASRPASRPTPPPTADTAAPDDLTEIDGIGPAFAAALKAVGITTFVQLAEQDPDDLAERVGGRITAARIRGDAWIEQARKRHIEGQG